MASSASYTKDFSVYTVKDSTGVRLQYILKSDSSLAALDLLVNRSEVVEWSSQQAGINDLMPLIRSPSGRCLFKTSDEIQLKGIWRLHVQIRNFRSFRRIRPRILRVRVPSIEYLPSSYLPSSVTVTLKRCVKGKLQRLLLGSAF